MEAVYHIQILALIVYENCFRGSTSDSYRVCRDIDRLSQIDFG
jgi:hypothetical protein